ncbi:MAG: DUF1629 domain-containing protein, partial [Paracoccaceae bacterium]
DVWVSRAMQDSTLVKPFLTADIWDDDEKADAAGKALKRFRLGHPIPSNLFPSECFVNDMMKKVRNLPPIFECASFWVVNEELATVLRHFDIGKTTFHPTKLFQFNRKTEIRGKYFFINFDTRKDTFLPEQSENVRKNRPTIPWALGPLVKDGDVAVDQGALVGADLWFEETMWKAIFMSGDLVDALRAAKLTRRLGLRKCKVI